VRRRNKDIRFSLKLDESFPERLYGDILHVNQIFSNILSNAFKYTKKGVVEWRLSTERDGDSVWVTSVVRDSGIGIRREDIGKLFADYNQVNVEANRSVEGTGLGLALAKKLVELMDGSITVESEYGSGSVFTVHIRQGFVSEKPIGAAVAERLRNFDFSDYQGNFTASDTKYRCVPPPGTSVLVVDDVGTNLDVTKGMLKPYGMKVDCLASGLRAVEAVQVERVRYNAIFMDHMMPGMDGVEAMLRIRSIDTDYAQTVPIIMLTANVISGNEAMFLEKGFQDFLAKPIDANRLDEVIRRWVVGEARDATPFPGWDIAEIDLGRALERFGGDRQTLLHVLRSYVKHTPALLRQAREVSEAGLEEYVVALHGFEGGSYGIGADAVGDQAKELERAARKGDFAFVTAHNAAFVASAEQLVADLDRMLSSVAPGKPEKDSPDPDALERLREACGRYDMDGVDTAMSELESFSYAYEEDLVPWLREQVDRTDLSRIEERLGGVR
jgi:CheY-like chemotaxis protein